MCCIYQVLIFLKDFHIFLKIFTDMEFAPAVVAAPFQRRVTPAGGEASTPPVLVAPSVAKKTHTHTPIKNTNKCVDILYTVGGGGRIHEQRQPQHTQIKEDNNTMRTQPRAVLMPFVFYCTIHHFFIPSGTTFTTHSFVTCAVDNPRNTHNAESNRHKQ